MRVLSGKSTAWILGSVALVAIVAAVLIGQAMLPNGSDPTTAAIYEPLSEPAQSIGPAEASLIRASTDLSSAVQTPNGGSSFSGQSDVVPVSIEITPAEDTNPVKTQHTFTVTVKQADGSPAEGAAVEFILNRFSGAKAGDGSTVYSVGDIVDISGVGPHKVDNGFGMVATDSSGQAELTITATREGETDVTAYAPGIADADTHKVFAVKRWVDINVDCPEPMPAANQAGSSHEMTIVVYRSSDGKDNDGNPVTPLPGYTVDWQIIDNDPAGELSDLTTVTDDNGESTVTLTQIDRIVGENIIFAEVLDEQDRAMFDCTVTKQWVAQDIVVDKTGPATLGLLTTGTYTITVTNTGNSTATDVTLTDTLPSGLEYVSANPQPSLVSGDIITWSLGNIPQDGSQSVEVTLEATQTGQQVNTADAESGGYSDTTTFTTTVFAGTLSVTKTGPDMVNLGDEFTYNVTVTNNGEGALRNVTLTEILPFAFTYVSSDTTTSSDFGPEWNLGTLAQDASASVAITVSADDTGTHTNRVDVVSDEGVSNSAEFSTTVVAPSVTVDKQVDKSTILVANPDASVGDRDTATFTIVVTNNGDGPAFNISVVDTLDAGLTTNDQTTWSIAELAAGAFETYSVAVRASAAGTYNNVVAVTVGDEDPFEARESVTALEPMVVLEKTGSGALFTGASREYTITATNNGPTELTGVTITDNFPTGMSYVSSNNGGSASGNVVTWPAVDLAIGQSHTVNVTLRGRVAGQYTNSASVTTMEAATDDATLSIRVLPAAGADLTIVDNPDPVIEGDQVTYTITVENQSTTTPMTEVDVTVTIPDEFSVISADNNGSIVGNVVTFPRIDNIAPEQSVVFTVTVRAEDIDGEQADTVASATLDYAEFTRTVTAQQGTTIIAQ